PAMDPVPNLTSSHVEIRVQPDNRTVTLHERNVYGARQPAHKPATTPTRPATPTSPTATPTSPAYWWKEQVLEHKDGESKPYTEVSGAEFHPNSENALTLVYHSHNYGPFLLTYTTTTAPSCSPTTLTLGLPQPQLRPLPPHLQERGNHTDVEALKKHQEDHRKLGNCLSLSGENVEEWHYDGAAEENMEREKEKRRRNNQKREIRQYQQRKETKEGASAFAWFAYLVATPLLTQGAANAPFEPVLALNKEKEEDASSFCACCVTSGQIQDGVVRSEAEFLGERAEAGAVLLFPGTRSGDVGSGPAVGPVRHHAVSFTASETPGLTGLVRVSDAASKHTESCN
ncbi:hypothetical protein WMY93_032342, partial [Mugilogobius chulae]